jgi:DNA polymerase III delta prime subunit
VTVNLKKGEAVSGTFLRADSKKVYLEVDGDATTIGLDNVTSLVFTEAESNSPAVKAIKALKSLAEAAEHARNNREYGNRLLEVKALVEDQITLIPEGDLREAISDALKAYELVGEIWDQTAQSVPQEETSKMTKEAVTKTLSGARKRLEEAEALLKQP